MWERVNPATWTAEIPQQPKPGLFSAPSPGQLLATELDYPVCYCLCKFAALTTLVSSAGLRQQHYLWWKLALPLGLWSFSAWYPIKPNEILDTQLVWASLSVNASHVLSLIMPGSFICVLCDHREGTSGTSWWASYEPVLLADRTLPGVQHLSHDETHPWVEHQSHESPGNKSSSLRVA